MEERSSEEITLRDIAQQTGFSLVSIHRALSGKPGISANNRERILSAARDMGYKPNRMAAALKRQTQTVAIVLPRRGGSGAEYFDYMWKGCDEYRQENDGYGVRFLEYCYDIGAHGAAEGADQIAVLERLYAEGTPLDGLLTAPVTHTDALTDILARFAARGVQIVLIDNDVPVDRLCCIAPNDENTGRLSAELMCDMIAPGGGSILVAGGNRFILCHYTNATGFADYVRTHRPELCVISEGDEDAAPDADRYYEALASNDSIIAAYSVRARSTMPLCEAALRLEPRRKLLVLGSDLFPESAEMLRRGVLRGIVYKNPYEKGYRALKVLLGSLRSGQHPATDAVCVPISVILRSNLALYRNYI